MLLYSYLAVGIMSQEIHKMLMNMVPLNGLTPLLTWSLCRRIKIALLAPSRTESAAY